MANVLFMTVGIPIMTRLKIYDHDKQFAKSGNPETPSNRDEYKYKHL